jgi:hypothetical protein
MRLSVTTLTAFCLVIHAIFGCCANHAECCQSSECCVDHSIDEAALESDHSCCSHAKSASQRPNVTPTDSAGHSPEPSKQQCSHDHCQWLVNKDCADSLVLGLEFLAFVSCRSERLVDSSAPYVDRAAVRTLLASMAPLRLYLDLGVLQV